MGFGALTGKQILRFTRRVNRPDGSLLGILVVAIEPSLNGEKTPEVLDARLECRIAMGVENLAQLAQQLNQTLAGFRASRVQHAPVDTQLQ